MSRLKNNQSLNGFGIIEVLISAFMIATMLGAAVIIANTGVQKTNFAQSKLIATNLANQAIEEIISIRNRAYLDKDPNTLFNNPNGLGTIGLPVEGLYKLDYSTTGIYKVALFPGKLIPTDSDSPQEIYYTVSNPYGYPNIVYDDTGITDVATIYYRTINIKDIKQSEANTLIGFNVQYNNITDPNTIVAKKIQVTVSWAESEMVGKGRSEDFLGNAQVDQTIILTDWKYGN